MRSRCGRVFSCCSRNLTLWVATLLVGEADPVKTRRKNHLPRTSPGQAPAEPQGEGRPVGGTPAARAPVALGNWISIPRLLEHIVPNLVP